MWQIWCDQALCLTSTGCPLLKKDHCNILEELFRKTHIKKIFCTWTFLFYLTAWKQRTMSNKNTFWMITIFSFISFISWFGFIGFNFNMHREIQLFYYVTVIIILQSDLSCCGFHFFLLWEMWHRFLSHHIVQSLSHQIWVGALKQKTEESLSAFSLTWYKHKLSCGQGFMVLLLY